MSYTKPTEGKSNQKDAIMSANNLQYKFDDVLNVSVNRTMKKQWFDTRSYTMPGSGQAVSTFNSGVDLLDVQNSYLKFRVKTDGGDRTAIGFGSGSAMNLIKEVKILSSSGIELARTQDANIYHKFVSHSRNSVNWHSTVGALMGNAVTDFDVATVVCIPLCELDPFFKLYDGKLLPANIASGLRVEITWADLTQAFLVSGGTTDPTSYTVDQIEFRTTSVTLADSAMALLNKQASTNGLEITYDRVYTTSKNTAAQTDDNIEVRKAVSLAKSAFCVTIPATQTMLIDSFHSTDFIFTSADMRVGSQYYPFQPLTNVQEGYFAYLRNYGKLKSTHECDTTLAEFETGGQSQLCATFETDDSLNLSALPINSSRILECRFVRSSGAIGIKSYVFLTYTALCRASLSNTSVKI